LRTRRYSRSSTRSRPTPKTRRSRNTRVYVANCGRRRRRIVVAELIVEAEAASLNDFELINLELIVRCVSGLFDLTLPPGNRNEYGIRLTDRTPSQAGDDVVEVRVTRGTDGIVKVQLVQHDFAANTHMVLQSFNLNPGSHNKILLTLTHDVIDGQVVHASFQLGTTVGEVVSFDAATNFNPAVAPAIFNGENWTRAQFFAEAPALSGTVLQDTYGQLEITQDGAWSYQLANGQANVQALAEGQTVQDNFAVQIADGQGGFDVETITINVSGTNDLPVAAADAAAISEDGAPNAVNGNLLTNDTDVDTRDTHTITALKVGEINGTDNGTTITAVGTYGTLVVTKATGGYTYTLANGQSNVQALQHAQQVTDVFTYTNGDNHGGVSNPSTHAPTLAAGTTATGHMVADTQGASAPLTELAASYLTAATTSSMDSAARADSARPTLRTATTTPARRSTLRRFLARRASTSSASTTRRFTSTTTVTSPSTLPRPSSLPR
jgi:VCBS repeat-containing protein